MTSCLMILSLISSCGDYILATTHLYALDEAQLRWNHMQLCISVAKSDLVKTVIGEPRVRVDIASYLFNKQWHHHHALVGEPKVISITITSLVLHNSLFSLQFTEAVQDTFRNTTAMVVNRYCAENNESCRQTVR